MKLESLESKLRTYESLNDRYVLPGMWTIVRVDGRNFTRLTKEVMEYEAPYDLRFRDAMVAAASHLMQAGTKSTLAYSERRDLTAAGLRVDCLRPEGAQAHLDPRLRSQRRPDARHRSDRCDGCPPDPAAII